MSRRAGYPGTFWPSKHHELGLRAALLPGDDGRSAWRLWRDRLDLEDLDASTYRLLPLVAYNLTALGVDDPHLGRLAGVRKRTWYDNQLNFAQLGSVLQYLEAKGIPTMVPTAALAVTVYPDAGLRPTVEFGVLVPFECTTRARRALEADGWTRSAARSGGLRGVHADILRRGNGSRIDLHRQLMPDLLYRRRRPEQLSAEIWQCAVPVSIGGVDTRALGFAHQLLHVCVRGAYAWDADRVGWVADAVHVLRTTGRTGVALNWNDLLRLAQARRVSRAAEMTLRYLAETFGAAVPAAVLAELARSPVTPSERALFWVHPRYGRLRSSMRTS